jgi:MarR family transcriptional regulator, organic hydroperoxide resistance regulator
MEPIEELRYLVLAVQREGNRLLAARLKEAGVTPSQGEVLRVLRDREPLTLTGLGELLVCETGSSPSRLVDRLVAQGLVHRQADPDDRRFVTLALTAEGRRVERRVVQVEKQLYAWLARLTGDRPLEPALELLRAVAQDLPAGQALARRAETGKTSAR